MPVLRTCFVDFNSNAARSANTYLKHCNIGDWFLLTQIGQNVDPFFFEDFMQELENLQYPHNENLENGENQQEALLNNSNEVKRSQHAGAYSFGFFLLLLSPVLQISVIKVILGQFLQSPK